MVGVKILGIMLIALLIANLVLFGIGILSALVFWLIIAAVAVVAWKVVPRMRKIV